MVTVVVDRPLGSRHPEEIRQATYFQERFFQSSVELIRE